MWLESEARTADEWTPARPTSSPKSITPARPTPTLHETSPVRVSTPDPGPRNYQAFINSTVRVIMTGEISYDLVMEDDMSFVEGTFRVGNAERVR
jgi:hypothetical protein